ncbi:iron siderophore-binding protein [Vibrio albus]|uniref:Iron siderophore-binding protein n=1 Tax=Vibrio albus TaxID=2200953 RepID=A0A2U3BC16_9VIBR|nr:Fe(3+) dicitrate ABC transporter substrate-binding protein [Vibrio albus]PWI34313.1 iron siderophore-binding protein [Vibrio albus]
MKRFLKYICCFALLFALGSVPAQAERVIKHELGTLTLTGTPSRIVVLEYSFVDALAAIGVSPFGVADDQDPERLLPQVRSLIKPWTSVGMRSQPNLEVIARLKPDLIIADAYRHKVSYRELSKIAPTLLLKSRGESYQESLQSASVIGRALNKEKEMNARIARHKAFMQGYRHKFDGKDITVQFANVNDRGMWFHGPRSYTGSLLEFLGLHSAVPELKSSHLMEVNLEVLLKTNPDWLFYGRTKPVTVLESWQNSPLFNLLKISQPDQAVTVSHKLWSLNRGMLAAEGIARELDTYLNRNIKS